MPYDPTLPPRPTWLTTWRSWSGSPTGKETIPMTFNHWQGFCLAGDPEALPPGAQPAETPLPPGVPHPKGPHARPRLVCHHPAGPAVGREDLPHPPARAALPQDVPPGLEDFVSRHGATVVNLAFAQALRRLEDWRTPKGPGLPGSLSGPGGCGPHGAGRPGSP